MSVHKCLRFSKKEYSEIENELDRTGLKFSEYSRKRILKDKKIKCKIDDLALYEIARIGNNLNQIARSVNSKSITNILLLEKLTEIEKEIKQIL